MTMADSIAVMNGGRIEQLGSPSELYERPQTGFVAGFLGKSNLLEGTVEPGGVRLRDGTLVQVDIGGRSGSVAIGVRPEKVRFGANGVNSLVGTVRETAYIGVASEVVLETAAGGITVFHQNADAGSSVPAPGSSIAISWSPEATFVVDRFQSDQIQEEEIE